MSWRDTLFIWRGEFKVQTDGQGNAEAHFKGRWVGVDAPDARDAALPSDDAFRAAPPMFWIHGTLVPGAPADSLDLASHYLLTSSGENLDGWELDQGDGAGLRWYGDRAHEARVVGDLVVARGENEFAPFVSTGYLSGYSHQLDHAGDNEWNGVTITKRKLTLARRYLDPGDERVGWSLRDVEREAREASEQDAPWMCEGMRAKRWTSHKRKR
jgi:hypothetical protein